MAGEMSDEKNSRSQHIDELRKTRRQQAPGSLPADDAIIDASRVKKAEEALRQE